jgi:hypothetical protein
LAKEDSNGSEFVLPILLHHVEVPKSIRHRPTIDFTADYGAGLRRLLAAMCQIAVKIAANLPHLRVVTARRGVRPTSGGLHLVGMTGFFGDTLGVLAVAESIGEREIARLLTNETGHVVRQMFERQMISRDSDDILRLFSVVDQVAKELNDKHGLRGVDRVACKMILALCSKEGASVAAVGKVGIVANAGSGIVFDNPTFHATLDRIAIRSSDGSSPFRAPLGYLVNNSLRRSQREIEWQAGGYVALTSFAVPSHEDDIGPLAAQLESANEPSDVAYALAASHWPPVEDAFVCLIQRL